MHDSSAAAGATRFDRLTLADTLPQTLLDEAAAILSLFLERDAEFGVHPSVVIHHPDLVDISNGAFLADAAGYVVTQASAMAAQGSPANRIVVLTTFGDVVGPSFEAAGYRSLPIDMPAGPDHTFAFMQGPEESPTEGRTLYVEAVDEADEKIRPTFVLKLTDGTGRLCGGACGSVHERAGKRYAYLATMTTAPGAEKGAGTQLAEELFRFMRDLGASTIHLGTQTAAAFYVKSVFASSIGWCRACARECRTVARFGTISSCLPWTCEIGLVRTSVTGAHRIFGSATSAPSPNGL